LANIASIWRYPVKGLTPEPLAMADLVAGAYFPNDRKYAVEVGPSGFDPASPAHVPKMRFTVLARFPELARLRTRLDDASGVFHIGDAHGFGVEVRLDTEDGRAALARFLQAYLGEEAMPPLKVLPAPDGHRFMDHPQGHVSFLNLATVRAVERAIGRTVDPLRFRANLHVEGLAAWDEDALEFGAPVLVGAARLTAFKPIERCVATHVDLETGTRDIDMLGELREHFGRVTLGTYLAIERGGAIREGDTVRLTP